jgi:hypothetical protein
LTTPWPIGTFLVDKKGRLFFLYSCPVAILIEGGAATARQHETQRGKYNHGLDDSKAVRDQQIANAAADQKTNGNVLVSVSHTNSSAVPPNAAAGNRYPAAQHDLYVTNTRLRLTQSSGLKR